MPKTSKSKSKSSKPKKMITQTSAVQDSEERKKNAIKALKIKNKRDAEQKRSQILRERIIYESSPVYLE